jgi:hypothetical protein
MRNFSGHRGRIAAAAGATIGAVIGFTLLVGCSTGPTASPAEIAAMENGLTATETVAYAYTSLKACASPVVQPCADPATKAKILAADNEAYSTLMALKANNGSVELTAAQAALSALVGAVPTK